MLLEWHVGLSETILSRRVLGRLWGSGSPVGQGLGLVPHAGCEGEQQHVIGVILVLVYIASLDRR